MSNKRNTLIILLIFLGCVSSHAAMESTSYNIPSLTISEGGEDEMSSSNYKLQDMKGQSVIGAGGTTNYNVELGGIYGMLGAQVVEIPGVPYGTVQLNIARDGNNIKISWDPAIRNPQILVRAGDGSGQYVNDGDATVWVDITDPSVAAEFETHMSESYVLHNDQVAAGHEEAYYKGLQSGVARAGTNPDTGDTNLASAWAVGKANVLIEGTSSTLGKNLISIPFQPQPSSSVADVFGEGSGTVWEDGDMIQKKNAPSPAYLSAVYAGGRWRDAADTSRDPFTIDYKFGYWVVTNSGKTITLVGSVANVDESIAIYDGLRLETGGKTLLGMVYPVAVGLTATSLISDGAEEGDMIQYKDSPLAPSYISAVVIGGVWKNAANPADPLDDRIGTLRIPHSYTFVRYGSSGFSWNRTRPF